MFKRLALLSAVMLASVSPLLHAATPEHALERIPQGELRTRLASLPAAAQQRALRWLSEAGVPAEDYPNLRADAQGAIFYADDAAPNLAGQQASTVVAQADSTLAALSAAEVFSLHSRPGAATTIYVDVDGEVIEGTAWNDGSTPLVALSYDTDGNHAVFSEQELRTVHEIWHRIAEDFAAWDVDVTTERPVNFTSTTGHILITENIDENGTPMPAQNAGGVAYLNVFGRSNYQQLSPALVYSNNLSFSTTAIAEASSHEIGHNLGLGHDGVEGGSSYFSGLGDQSNPSSWAPIMGASYYRQLTQWSRGEYPNASNSQDDTQIIGAKLGSAEDDHADTLSAATPLTIDADGQLRSTNPENDPANFNVQNKGVIQFAGDADVFSVAVAAGQLTLRAQPGWMAFERSTRRGSNLDVALELLDSNGNLIAESNPLTETDATVTASVAAGTYYLNVRGVGNTSIPYSDYASQGQYFITGQATPGVANQSPEAANDSAVTAEDTAVEISVLDNDSDPEGDVLQLLSVAAPNSGQTSIVANQIRYQPDGDFNGSDQFEYTIGDGLGGRATALVTVSVTPVADAPIARDDTATTNEGETIGVAVLANDSDPDDDALTIQSFTAPANGSVVQSGTQLSYSPNPGFSGSDAFTYTVTDGTANSSASVTITVAPPAPKVPDAPSGLTAVSGDGGAVQLTWNEVTGATSYVAERQTKHKRRSSWLGTTQFGAGSGTGIVNAPGSGTYRYRLAASNITGTSGWSGWVEVTVADSGGGKGKKPRK